MLKKVLFSKQNKTQLIISMVGALLGFTFLLTAVHYYVQIQSYGKSSEMMGDGTLILQKKISSLSTFNLVKSDFSAQDIEKIAQEDFIVEVNPILNNNFDITIQTDSEIVPYFRSDIFVQSVEAKFLGLQPLFWNWTPESDYVPVVLPKDFLVMLNTFANAKGLPSVSEDLATSIGFKFTLYDAQHKEQFKVKIIGFTSKISAIVVPPSFIQYGNKNFTSPKDEKYTQLIVSVEKGNFGSLEKFMKSHGLESSENSMIIGKMQSIGTTLFSALIIIGLITVFLAGLILVQYTQITIAENRYEITTLQRLGYDPSALTKVISRYFIKAYLIVGGLSFLLFSILKLGIDSLFFKSGLFIAKAYTVSSILILIITLTAMLVSNYLKARKEVNKC